ncbi:MAG: hypothetical protein ACI89L_001731 [Phycisphaerales bacterium]|jgi:hypothetical protein
MRPRFSRSLALLASLGLLGLSALGAPAFQPAEPSQQQPERAEPKGSIEKLTEEQRAKLCLEKFDVDKNALAIKGYDPVSYFPEGGSTPTRGDKKIELVRLGVHYRFASEAHRELFKADPEKYEPAYGGWCAYAMAKGDYTAPDPKRYLIQNGKLMLFYDGFFGDTYKKWNDEEPKVLEPLADTFWMSEVEEEAVKIVREDE